jgi:ATP synthase protein I
VSFSGRPAGPGRNSPGRAAGPGAGPGEENAGWSVFSYLIAGMAAYGGIGWLIGHWLHATILFPVGMLTGLVLAIVLIIYRYGRP